MVEKIKAHIDRLHLVSKMKKSSISQNILEIFFALLNSKVVYLRPFLSSLLQSGLVYRDIRDSSIETLDRSPYPNY